MEAWKPSLYVYNASIFLSASACFAGDTEKKRRKTEARVSTKSVLGVPVQGFKERHPDLFQCVGATVGPPLQKVSNERCL